MPRDYSTRIEQKRAELQQLEALHKKEQRDADRNRKIIVGAIILREMETSPEFRAQIAPLLDRKITGKRDREIVEPWLSTT